MVGVLLAVLVTVWIACLVWRDYKPQSVIFAGGMILLACSALMGQPIIGGKQSLGTVWFDFFKVIEDLMSARIAGLGLMIMSVAGFVRYMEHIGASKAFVRLGVKPLKLVPSLYLVLALAYLIGQTMKMAIISAAGLGLLLMATMYPILIGLGASRAGAAAVIVSCSCLDLGPASATSTFVAKTAGIDVAVYAVHYQLVAAIPVVITVAVLHYFVQQWFDRKEGHQVVRSQSLEDAAAIEDAPPRVYAFLPVLPLVLLFAFNPVFHAKVRISLISAMLLGLFVSMLMEYVCYRDYKKVARSIQSFFDGMGASFATVVSLIVAAETFAAGLTRIGAIDTIIRATQTFGFGDHAMIVVMQAVIAVAAFITGSGDASMFSFGALVPTMAKQLSIDPVHMLLPMQFTGGIARSASPVSAVCVAVAGLAMVSPVEVIRRSAIPMAGALVVATITNLLLF